MTDNNFNRFQWLLRYIYLDFITFMDSSYLLNLIHFLTLNRKGITLESGQWYALLDIFSDL